MKENERILLNKKQFNGKFHKSIVDGMTNKYKELYPDKLIKIGYYSEIGTHYYNVIVEPFPFIKNGIIENVQIIVGKYTNLAAISFSDISEEEFQLKFNDSSYENYNILRQELESLATMIKLRGYATGRIDVSDGSYTFEIKVTDGKGFSSDYRWIRGNFDIVPISKPTIKRVVNKIKKEVEYFISKNPIIK